MIKPARSFQVLLIEDSPEDRHLLVEAILRCGVPASCIMYARDGEEALDLLERLEALDSLPDLILLDLNMPRLDGHAVLRELRRMGILSRVSVTVMSTSSDEYDVKRVYAAGGHSYIVKPYSFERLVEIMSCVGEYMQTMIPPSAAARH